MITLDKFKHGIVVREDETDPALRETQFPNISICQEVRFGDMLALGSLSCLQMTAVGLYFSWKFSGNHPSIDEAMQSEPPMSEPATIQDLVGPNNQEDDSGHETEGDDSCCTTVLEDLPTQGNLTKNSTSASSLTQVGDAPEDDGLDNEIPGAFVFLWLLYAPLTSPTELMSVSNSSHSDSEVDLCAFHFRFLYILT